MKSSKIEKAFNDISKKQNHLVVQGNDLAKAFGNLKAFEHKVLDYCFSFVQKDSKAGERFVIEIATLLKFFNLTSSGTNYERVMNAFKVLNENTSLYLPIEEDGVKGIMMTQLFRYINLLESGVVKFEFSEYAQPFVFDLKKNYYSFRLSQIARIKGKYALILLKLWEANKYTQDNTRVIIQGSLEDWQGWFLGEEKRLPAGEFLRSVITRASEELEEKFEVNIYLEVQKEGRKVTGYRMDIQHKAKESDILRYDWLDI